MAITNVIFPKKEPRYEFRSIVKIDGRFQTYIYDLATESILMENIERMLDIKDWNMVETSEYNLMFDIAGLYIYFLNREDEIYLNLIETF